MTNIVITLGGSDQPEWVRPRYDVRYEASYMENGTDYWSGYDTIEEAKETAQKIFEFFGKRVWFGVFDTSEKPRKLVFEILATEPKLEKVE